MTKPFKSNSDRQMVVQRVATTFGRHMQLNHSVSHLRAAMFSRMDSALRGTAYDRVGGRSADRTSPTERQALLSRGDKAHDDADQMDRDLRTLEVIERRWYHWGLEYVTYETGDRGKQKPGEGTCPVGKCANCWEFGRDEGRSERYKDACDICGRWKADHGERMIKPLWRIRVEQGKARVTTGDLRTHAPHLLPKDQAS